MGYACGVCGKNFKRTSKLNEHVKYTHAKERKFICDVPECEKSYKRRDHLQRHKELVHEDHKAYVCPTCGVEIRYKYNFVRHQKLHDRDEKPYVCDQLECSYCFKKEINLIRHKRDIHGILPYCCDFPGCDKQYSIPSSLKSHKIYAHTEKYICGYKDCAETFIKHCQFIQHKKTAHPSKYTCPHCKRECSNSLTLQRHISAKHSKNPQIFSCPICGIESKYRSNLNTHIKCKHDKKKFQCDFCEKLFQYPHTKRRHILKYHLQEVEEQKILRKTKPDIDVLLGGIPPRRSLVVVKHEDPQLSLSNNNDSVELYSESGE